MNKKEDVEVFEVYLDDKKIDELIRKLSELKSNKEHEHFDDKNNNHVLFVHEKTKIL